MGVSDRLSKLFAQRKSPASSPEQLSIIRAEQPLGLPERPAALEAAAANSQWVYRAVTIIARAVSSLPIVVQVRGRDGDLIPAPEHPAQILFQSVNNTLSESELWYRVMTWVLLRGEAVVAIEPSASGQPAELWPLAPQWLQPMRDIDSERGRAWKYGRTGATGRVFYEDELIWWKLFNPEDPTQALSPLQCLTTALSSDYLAQQLNQSMMRNRALPDAVLTTQQPIPEERARRIVAQWKQELGAPQKAHRPVILPYGLEYHEIQRSLADIEYIRGREITRDEILAVYGVPPILAGIIASGWGESEAVQRKLFWSDTILTWTSWLDGLLTERSNEIWPAQPPIYTRDLSSVEHIIGKENELIERYAPLVQSGILTINEFRTELGREPVPWGDSLWTSVGYVPVTSSERPATPVAMAALGGTRGRKSARRSDGLIYWPESLKEPRMDAFRAEEQKEIARIERDVRAFLEDRAKTIRPNMAVPFDKREWVNAFYEYAITTFGPVLWSAYQREGEVLRLASKVFRKDVPEEAVVVPEVLIDSIEAMLRMEEQAQRFATAIPDTVWDKVRNALSDGIREGASYRELEEAVQMTMGSYIQSSAMTIATTEVHASMTAGQLARWIDGGEVWGKMWRPTFRATRPTHEKAAGQLVPVKDNFIVGGALLERPGDPKGPVQEIINCECQMEPVLRD